MSSIRIFLVILLVLGVVEGMAYWWMNPTPAGLGDPVLVYRPVNRDQKTEDGGQKTEDENSSSSQNQQSKINNHQSSITPSPSSTDHRSLLTDHPPTTTPLPEIVSRAIPTLRCSTGTAARIDRDDGVTIHVAFFEWNDTDTGSVLEAFRHMPEACLGSLGMKFVSYEKIIPYQVGSETLYFDHTVFSEGEGAPVRGSLVHSFRAVWVSGLTEVDARQGLGGDEFDRLRTIRLKSALTRFKPAHARVAQGAVRGVTDPKLAWKAFEETMLVDLKMEKAERVITSN